MTPDLSDTDPLEAAARASAGTLMERLAIEWIEVGPDRVVARMPVVGNTQPFGSLHGGATAALCESVASLGATLAAGAGRVAVGIELNINHLRAVRHGLVTAIGVALHSGNSTAVWDVRVDDKDGTTVAVSRATLAFRSA